MANKFENFKTRKKEVLRTSLMIFMTIVFTSHYVYGQEKTIPINVSYFGETFVHPGIEIGYENTFYKKFNYTASIGTYFHQRNHTGLFLSGGLNWRYTFSFGYSPEFGIGFGYLHTWEAGGSTYTVDENGNVSKKTKWGHPHIMPSLKLGLLGWDLRKKTNIP